MGNFYCSICKFMKNRSKFRPRKVNDEILSQAHVFVDKWSLTSTVQLNDLICPGCFCDVRANAADAKGGAKSDENIKKKYKHLMPAPLTSLDEPPEDIRPVDTQHSLDSFHTANENTQSSTSSFYSCLSTQPSSQVSDAGTFISYSQEAGPSSRINVNANSNTPNDLFMDTRPSDLDIDELLADLSSQNLSEPNSQSAVTTNDTIQHSQQSSCSSLPAPNTFRIPLASATVTQSRCFICNKKERARIPKLAISQIWRKKKIRVAPGNRCCPSHLLPKSNSGQKGKLVKEEIIEKLVAAKPYSDMTSKEIAELILELTGQLDKKKLDFESLPANKFPILTGLTQEQFFNLYEQCKTGLHNSKNRSKANALGMFLMKLRMDFSDLMLSFLFEIESASVVSETIRSVRMSLMQLFVPKHLGYGHKSNEELVELHSVKAFGNLIDMDLDSLVLILDGTYLYIEKPTDLDTQWAAYSGQKKRHLVKPMMVVSTSGYIVDVAGPYGADGHNNDAGILKHMLSDSDSLSNLMGSDGAFVLDRGFRDCILAVEGEGIQCFMPKLLGPKEKQFMELDANASRLVTMIRYIVECLNGRIKKKFKFFRNVISNNHLPSLGDFFRISCAIINAYCPPLQKDSELLQERIDLALLRKDIPNTMKDKILSEHLDRRSSAWKDGNKNDAMDFPKITDEDMRILTLGTFQSEMAKAYISHQLKKDPEFSIKCSKQGKMVQAKIQSKYRKSKKHQCFVEYDTKETGHTGIIGYYCKCNNGARTLGCCSHVASLVWYLGNVRFNLDKLPKKKDFTKFIINAKLPQVNADEDSDPDVEPEDSSEDDDD